MKERDFMKKMLDVVFILDKSGSMSGSEEHTISSFNEYLEKEKKKPYHTKITTILFSDSYHYLHRRVSAKEVLPLTEKDYYVEGCTALYDALGNGIHYIDRCHTDQVLFVIITDGYENASKEFSKDKVKCLIEKHPNWEFIYIGADIDSYATGGEIGIQKDHIASYKKSKTGTSKLFSAIQSFEGAMACGDVSACWKEELDDYIEKNSK